MGGAVRAGVDPGDDGAVDGAGRRGEREGGEGVGGRLWEDVEDGVVARRGHRHRGGHRGRGGRLAVGGGDLRAEEDLVPGAAEGEDLGVGAYMALGALNRLMQEGNAISGAFLYIDEQYANEIYQELKDRPQVTGSVIRSHEIRNFHKTMDETLLFWTAVATIFAVVIAVGVVYNSARITLTERSRELASLRVLGYTRGEISYILLGELTLLTLAALPVGLGLGRALCAYIALSLENDMYRVPLIIEPSTYAFAALVVLLAAAVSSLLVRRRLDELDLIEVLKTKE